MDTEFSTPPIRIHNVSEHMVIGEPSISQLLNNKPGILNYMLLFNFVSTESKVVSPPINAGTRLMASIRRIEDSNAMESNNLVKVLCPAEYRMFCTEDRNGRCVSCYKEATIMIKDCGHGLTVFATYMAINWLDVTPARACVLSSSQMDAIGRDPFLSIIELPVVMLLIRLVLLVSSVPFVERSAPLEVFFHSLIPIGVFAMVMVEVCGFQIASNDSYFGAAFRLWFAFTWCNVSQLYVIITSAIWPIVPVEINGDNEKPKNKVKFVHVKPFELNVI
ncbi:hypothetical protein M3Y94_01100700 [Aphelenchoides besseyi]|nr:hypothetical protein M3Y94_01100700 [Aphelenchoides besseyi]